MFLSTQNRNYIWCFLALKINHFLHFFKFVTHELHFDLLERWEVLLNEMSFFIISLRSCRLTKKKNTILYQKFRLLLMHVNCALLMLQIIDITYKTHCLFDFSWKILDFPHLFFWKSPTYINYYLTSDFSSWKAWCSKAHRPPKPK